MRTPACLFLSALILAPASAFAEYAIIEIEGAISGVSHPSDELFVPLGTPVTISMGLDLETPAWFPDAGPVEIYFEAMEWLNVKIGPHENRLGCYIHCHIDGVWVRNDDPSYWNAQEPGLSDALAFSAELDYPSWPYPVWSLAQIDLYFTLTEDKPPGLFDSLELPRRDLSRSDFETAYGEVLAYPNSGDAGGYNLFEITRFSYTVSAIPEPQTWLGMLAGLAVLGSVLRLKRLS